MIIDKAVSYPIIAMFAHSVAKVVKSLLCGLRRYDQIDIAFQVFHPGAPHIWGSSRMRVRCTRTLIVRVTSALQPPTRGASFNAMGRLRNAEPMEAIRASVTAPDLRPWKEHYKPRLLISGLPAEMSVIFADGWCSVCERSRAKRLLKPPTRSLTCVT